LLSYETPFSSSLYLFFSGWRPRTLSRRLSSHVAVHTSTRLQQTLLIMISHGLPSLSRSLRALRIQSHEQLISRTVVKQQLNPQLRGIAYQSRPIDRFRVTLNPFLISSKTTHSQIQRQTTRIITTKHMTKELPRPNRPIARFFFRAAFYLGVVVGGVGLFVVGFFIYDATTYRETPALEDVPISSLALNPRRGGPKNLLIVDHLVDDDDCDTKKLSKHQPKLVVLGTGWGAVSLIKSLHPEQYHITVVSPSNQFLFTPMLPSATVGTLELRSLVEPIRGIVNAVHGHYLRAMAVDVVYSEKLIEVESVDSKGQKQSFYIPYDKLVIACGLCHLAPTHY